MKMMAILHIYYRFLIRDRRVKTTLSCQSGNGSLCISLECSSLRSLASRCSV